MRYEEVKHLIKAELSRQPSGLTWGELKERLDLPYKMLCPEWTAQLEEEIGLNRKRSGGRAYTWTLKKSGGKRA